MRELEVRPAAAEDVRKIITIERECAGTPHWSDGVWAGVFAGGVGLARAVWVAEVGGTVVGFLVASCVAAVGEIESVAVRHEVRRHGVGRALCVEAMAWARGLGAERMELEVRASSAGARGMYGALGFVEQGRRGGYYREPMEDAVQMVVSLGG